MIWLQHDGSYTESPDILAARLEQAAAQFDITPADNVRLRSWLIPLALAIKERMTLAGSRRWILPTTTVIVRSQARNAPVRPLC